MGTSERRVEPRIPVRLVVSYSNAAEFVSEYVENLSSGGLFLANATLALGAEIDIEIRLPGQGEWRVRGQVRFQIDAAQAAEQRRRPGSGIQITHAAPGFKDALLGYLLRLGRRRDVAVMIDAMPGAEGFAAAGYQVVDLADPAAFRTSLADHVIAVVVRPEQEFLYRAAAQEIGKGDVVFVLEDPAQVPDLIAQLDALL